jgi:hypothetical protein
MKKIGDERRIYIYTHPKWAPKRFHGVYNWERDPIRQTISAVYAEEIKNSNADIEQPLNITLPKNNC